MATALGLSLKEAIGNGGNYGKLGSSWLIQREQLSLAQLIVAVLNCKSAFNRSIFFSREVWKQSTYVKFLILNMLAIN